MSLMCIIVVCFMDLVDGIVIFFGPNDAESVGNDQNDIIIFFLFCSITSVESSR